MNCLLFPDSRPVETTRSGGLFQKLRPE